MLRLRYLGALAAALGLASIAGAVPAQAQFWGNWGYSRVAPPPEMMPDTVVRGLNRAGYKVRQIRRKGGVFVVDVNEQGGRPLRLVVDVANGTILQRYAMANPRGGVSDAPALAHQPALAPAEGAPAAPKSRSPTPRKPAPSKATVAPAPVLAPAPEQAAPEAPTPVTAAAPPAPTVGPGYANGVPINPLD